MPETGFDSQRRFPALDGIRGLAAMAVVQQHTWGVLQTGALGVEIFFALSGFLVGGILIDTAGKQGWASSFFLRRIARIWPLYFLIVAVVVLTQPYSSTPNLIPAWMMWAGVANFGAADVMQRTRLSPYTLWSVCIEEHAYLLLPLVVRFVKRHWLPLALLLIVLESEVARVWSPSPFAGAFSTQSRLDGIAFGVLAAWIVRSRTEWTRFAAPVALVALGWRFSLLNQSIWDGRSLLSTVVNQSSGSLGAAALIVALVSGRVAPVGQLLATRPLRFLGSISYGLYLFHSLVLEAWLEFWPMPDGIPLFAIVSAATIGIATLSFRFFEQPILRLAHRRPRVALPLAVGT